MVSMFASAKQYVLNYWYSTTNTEGQSPVFYSGKNAPLNELVVTDLKNEFTSNNMGTSTSKIDIERIDGVPVSTKHSILSEFDVIATDISKIAIPPKIEDFVQFGNVHEVCLRAVIDGDLNKLIVSRMEGLPLGPAVFDTAAIMNKGTIVEYLLNSTEDKLMLKQTNLCTIAAATNNLRMLKMAHLAGCTIDIKTSTYAAWNGSKPCLMYLYEVGCPIDAETICYYAANKGNVECLEYLCTLGYKIDYKVMLTAIINGHISILEYMYNINMKLDATVYRYASIYGLFESMEYIYQRDTNYRKYANNILTVKRPVNKSLIDKILEYIVPHFIYTTPRV